jgi:hypothetical protein
VSARHTISGMSDQKLAEGLRHSCDQNNRALTGPSSNVAHIWLYLQDIERIKMWKVEVYGVFLSQDIFAENFEQKVTAGVESPTDLRWSIRST